MITVRPSAERGRAEHGWLHSRHTFSFGDYHDPAHMGFRALRVINEDIVEGGQGFATHSHRDMEIVSVVLRGAVEHRDSMGNGSVIRAGDVQLMRAGSGVTHSEYNHSADEAVHFLQIWILPDRRNLPPAYEQKAFPAEQRRGAWRVVVSSDGRDGSLPIHQDVAIFACILDAGAAIAHAVAPGRHAWLQMVRGSATLNGVALAGGDGAAVSDEASVELVATSDCEALLFDLA